MFSPKFFVFVCSVAFMSANVARADGFIGLSGGLVSKSKESGKSELAPSIKLQSHHLSVPDGVMELLGADEYSSIGWAAGIELGTEDGKIHVGERANAHIGFDFAKAGTLGKRDQSIGLSLAMGSSLLAGDGNVHVGEKGYLAYGPDVGVTYAVHELFKSRIGVRYLLPLIGATLASVRAEVLSEDHLAVEAEVGFQRQAGVVNPRKVRFKTLSGKYLFAERASGYRPTVGIEVSDKRSKVIEGTGPELKQRSVGATVGVAW